MPITFLEQLADRLNRYVAEIGEFARARYRTTRWTNDLAVAVRTDLTSFLQTPSSASIRPDRTAFTKSWKSCSF